jgi:hypothetical protein
MVFDQGKFLSIPETVPFRRENICIYVYIYIYIYIYIYQRINACYIVSWTYTSMDVYCIACINMFQSLLRKFLSVDSIYVYMYVCICGSNSLFLNQACSSVFLANVPKQASLNSLKATSLQKCIYKYASHVLLWFSGIRPICISCVLCCTEKILINVIHVSAYSCAVTRAWYMSYIYLLYKVDREESVVNAI